MVHAQTGKREIVDSLSQMGLSISYDRVIRISAEMGDAVCQQFHSEQVVCPPKMKSCVFTTAAVDNIDHNSSSTTSKESFHGTSISLFQHPNSIGEGLDRNTASVTGSSRSKTVGYLPNYYTEVPPVPCSIKGSPVPENNLTFLSRENFSTQEVPEYSWLEHTKISISSNTMENVSWAAYHATQLVPVKECVICPSALLPLFLENVHTAAMIKHSMDIVKNAVEHLNAGQAPVITFDQPLFTLAKQIQWKWPDLYGEDKFVVMMGGLHCEMAFLKTLGDWLSGSGWVEALVQAGIATAGVCESFLKATHVKRTRRAHELTACALNILQHQAYQNYKEEQEAEGNDYKDFAHWCDLQIKLFPQFQYWDIVMKLEICLLAYVRSLRQGDFTLYRAALAEMTPWFFALDHTNYARWTPVHLRDMAELESKHPNIKKQFDAGKFTVKKTNRLFSGMPLDQAHEQNNACIKGDGGAVGITDNPNALRRWMVAGPEVARIIREFDDTLECSSSAPHHEQTKSFQASFFNDLKSLVETVEELGNPFLEQSKDVLVLDTKEIKDSDIVTTVANAQKIGQEQFENFVKDCLIERSKPLENPIKRNKLPLFSSPRKKPIKGKQQILSMKNNVELFSRLYIGCQTRGADLDSFFRHENQAFPPSLSDLDGKLRFGTKSDLLTCLEENWKPQSAAPEVTCLILDGAALVQMLKPTHQKTFSQYAKEIFISFIASKLRNVTRLDLVWDTYLKNTLKGTARMKRGTGVRRRVVAEATIPRNWQNFLHVNDNKTELFTFLSQQLMDESLLLLEGNKQLVVTDGKMVLSNQPLKELHTMAPCTHEEADTRMLLHAAHACKDGHHKILIRTVDTDVVVLSVSVYHKLPQSVELWVEFGTGTKLRYLAAHKIAESLGQSKTCALPMFHALTGCDTVSSFSGHGKKKAWTTWNVLPELTGALVGISLAHTQIPEQILHTIERFVILLYDRTSANDDIDKERKKLFTRKANVQNIPPTKAALIQHVKRAVYQGGHVWGQTLIADPQLPSPTSWGWNETADKTYNPHWTDLPDALSTCFELISCKCTKNCEGRRCKCKKSNLPCTALCSCEGDC